MPVSTKDLKPTGGYLMTQVKLWPPNACRRPRGLIETPHVGLCVPQAVYLGVTSHLIAVLEYPSRIDTVMDMVRGVYTINDEKVKWICQCVCRHFYTKELIQIVIPKRVWGYDTTPIRETLIAEAEIRHYAAGLRSEGGRGDKYTMLEMPGVRPYTLDPASVYYTM